MSASISILILLMAFTTSTYAWFASSNTVEVGIVFSSSQNDNYWFSLDGETWTKSFTGPEVYKQLENLYPEQAHMFYEEINVGSVANPVYKKDYKYTYKLLTPLATETGFASTFYRMEHTVVDSKVAFIFHNETNIYENNYSPISGYVKFNIKIKSDIDSFLYLYNSSVLLNGVSTYNDYTSTSLLRIGFETDLYNSSKYSDGTDNPYYVNNQYVEEGGVKKNVLKHIKIHEPVKQLPDSLSSYVGGSEFLYNSTGVGRYFSSGYLDDFVTDMRKENSLLVFDESKGVFTFNKFYENIYGEDIDKMYDFKYINDVIENKLSECSRCEFDSNGNVSSGTPLLRLTKDEEQELTIYIWLEGWDGAACDFSQLGNYAMSLSFVEVER